jgi:MFS family permease
MGSDDDPQSLVAGVRATAREPGPRIMVLALAVCFIVIGALDVLAVVVAVELLGKPEAYSGYLTTAAGAGGLTAGVLALALIGRRWIAPWIVISALTTGVALVGISIADARVVPSMFGFVVFGVAAATYELTALMLLQRVARLDLVGHVFTIVEALQMAMLAVGAAIVPLAVHLVGSHWAPAAVGVLFALLVGALATRIVLIDRHARVPITEMAALRSIPLLGALPGPALETIAKEARRVAVPAGEVVVRQGEPGHDYFAVINGEVIVSIDGVDANRLGRGQGFGEIALLRDVPRTATVRAATDATLLTLSRDAFLTALTGHVPTHERATSIAKGYSDRG